MSIVVGAEFSDTLTSAIGSNEGAVQAVAHPPGALHSLSPMVAALLLQALAALHELFPIVPVLL